MVARRGVTVKLTHFDESIDKIMDSNARRVKRNWVIIDLVRQQCPRIINCTGYPPKEAFERIETAWRLAQYFGRCPALRVGTEHRFEQHPTTC